MANAQKLITFTPRQIEMGDEIAQELGYNSFSQVVQVSLVEKYQRTFPNYMQRAKDEAPVDRVRRKEQEKQAKKDVEKDKLLRIAAALGGRIADEEGGEFCYYFTYTGKKRYEQKVPLNMLSEDLIAAQYQPSKAAVEKLQAEGKTDYKINE